MQQIFVVDEATCVGCGECAADCPYSLIVMDGDRPYLPAEQAAMCVKCHHCLAICPTAAVTIHGCKPEDSLPLPGNKPTAEQMAMLIKSRRTTRRYKPDSLTKEEIDFLMETLAYAPTGVNNRGVLFTLIDDPEVMEVFRQATYQALQEKMDGGGLPAGMEYLEEAVKRAKESGIDTIFRGAPHFIIATSPQDGPSPEVDCHIALSYFELLAAGMGLGTVWSGLAKWSLTMLAPQLLQKLGIPESHSIGYMMAFGRPAVTYHRTVQRQNRSINRVTSFIS